MSPSFSDIVENLASKVAIIWPTAPFAFNTKSRLKKMAVYQLSPGIFRNQIKQFEWNKFLLSENESLTTKNAGIFHKKTGFEDCITR